MSNMSYCRFENTTRDFEDCLDALREEGSVEEYIENQNPSNYEKESIIRLIELAKEMVEEFGDDEWVSWWDTDLPWNSQCSKSY